MSFSEDFPEDFSEDFLLPVTDFTPVETPELPDGYTPLAEFDLSDETIDPSHPDDPEANKFTPCDRSERIHLIRNYIGMIAGPDAKQVTGELLINDAESEKDEDALHIIHLSVGTLASGEVVVVATDNKPEMIEQPDREKSVNLAGLEGNDQPLKGDKLTKALEASGENGRGFMISAMLATDGVVHMTPARDEDGNLGGKDLWVKVRDIKGQNGQGDTQLAA